MPYSDADFYEIDRDPVRMKAYFWHSAQRLKVMASRENLPYLARAADAILESLDQIVEATIIKDKVP